jgi:hypothetical protein
MTKEKVVNYSPEAEARLKEVYGASENDVERKSAVDALASELGKTPASVRAKLSRLEIYVKPERVAKNGDAIMKKDALVEEIAANLGEFSEDLPGLEKANKSTLKILANATVPAKATAE